MATYLTIVNTVSRILPKHLLFRYGFNFSPMYRRTTGRVTYVAKDLLAVRIKLRISWRNKNYVGSIFGGSMFSAADPIPMVQLINLIGTDYVVWDKSAEIFFKKPAREDVFAEFSYTLKELEEIKQKVATNSEIEIVKSTRLTNQSRTEVYCLVNKTIYIADKNHYRMKAAARKSG